MDIKNTHRFSANQPVSDITVLLWKLGDTCISHMHTLMYGTEHKHGYLFSPIDQQMYNDERASLLDNMMEVIQELGITQEEIATSWQRTQETRKESIEWGKRWLKDKQ